MNHPAPTPHTHQHGALSLYSDEQGVPEIIAKIRRGKRNIMSMVLLFIILAVLYLLWTAPHYQYNAVLRINPGATQLTSETSLGSEMSIVSSWSLAKDALERLGPPVDILVHRPPYVENLLPFANRWVPPTEINISEFDIDERLLGRHFILTADSDTSFSLESPDGTTSAIKAEGKYVVPGQTFTLIPRRINSFVSSLQSNVAVSYHSLNAPDMMQVSFTHSNPAFAKQFLNSLIDEYIEQSKERQSAKSRQSVSFLEQAVERDLLQLRRKELEFKILRETEEFIDLDLEAEYAVKRSSEIEFKLDDLRTQFEEAQNYYTPEHPSYRILLDQMTALQKERRKIAKGLSDMPRQHQQLVELTREIEALETKYQENVQKLNNESIDIASAPGYAQLIDPPGDFPEVVMPNSKRIIVLAAMLGFILSTGWVLFHDSLTFAKATSASLLKRLLHLPVVATIPKHRTSLLAKKQKITLVRDDYSDAFDRFGELARKLDFITRCSDNKVVAITAASDNQGCTFVSANLALAVASRKKKVLLVDANINNSMQHEALGIAGNVGLTNVIVGLESIDKAVHHDEKSGLWVLPAGEQAPNAFKLLTHKNFRELMEKVANVYDVVIIDYPSDVAMDQPDSLAFAGSTLVVTGYNSSVIMSARLIDALYHSGVNVTGTILNNAIFSNTFFLIRWITGLFSSK